MGGQPEINGVFNLLVWVKDCNKIISPWKGPYAHKNNEKWETIVLQVLHKINLLMNIIILISKKEETPGDRRC